jgi:hypothetical protein
MFYYWYINFAVEGLKYLWCRFSHTSEIYESIWCSAALSEVKTIKPYIL